jgi:hypothetical protein
VKDIGKAGESWKRDRNDIEGVGQATKYRKGKSWDKKKYTVRKEDGQWTRLHSEFRKGNYPENRIGAHCEGEKKVRK